jgi:DNA-binding NtrC family response regulator
VTVDVLLVEDHDATREQLRAALTASGFEVMTAPNGARAIALLREHRPRVVVSDYRMAPVDGLELLGTIRKTLDVPFILYSAGADAEAIFRAGRGGAFFFLEYPFRIEDQLVPTIVESLSRRAPPHAPATGAERFIGDSVAAYRVRSLVRRVAGSTASVLVTGETGTGKELVARAIHEESGRSRLVSVAVTELADGLLESELFGHARGAFTGAVSSHEGLFAQADGGTLFLDEIGDADPRLQARLLRVLESAEVRPIGATAQKRIDVRIVTATNRDLAEDVLAGRFRQDLYFRIRQAVLQVPPLRERLADVEPIARALLGQLAREARLPVPAPDADFFGCLRAQAWMGNVRELRTVLQNVMLDWDGVSALGRAEAGSALAAVNDTLNVEDRSFREQMLEAYRRCDHNQEAARRELGLSRGEWRHRWARFGFEALSTRRR